MMFNSQSIYQLTNSLSRFKSFLDESVSAGLFWPDGDTFDPDNCIVPKARLADSYKLLHQLKDFHEGLSSLSSIVPRKIIIMQETLLRSSMHHGLLSLPRDIFIHIIDILYAECKDREETNMLIRQLSSVSKAFRAAVLDTVSLWKDLDNEYCLAEGFETRFSRSRGVSLTLYLDLSSYEEWEKVLSVTLPFSARWRILVANFGDNVGNVTETSPLVSFPQLEEARFWFMESDDYGEFDDSDELFVAWTFPHIKKLEVHGAIPPPGAFRDLVCLTLVGCRVVGSNIFFQRLAVSLDQMHCLRELSLGLYLTEVPNILEFPIVELPALTKFSISNYYPHPGYSIHNNWNTTAPFLGQILRSLKMPSAKDIRLQISFTSQRNESIVEWVMSFSSVKDVLHRVTLLSLITDFPVNSSAIDDFFAYFPNIQVLEVDALGFLPALLLLERRLGLNRLYRSVVALRECDTDEYWSWKDEDALYMLTENSSEMEYSRVEGIRNILEIPETPSC